MRHEYFSPVSEVIRPCQSLMDDQGEGPTIIVHSGHDDGDDIRSKINDLDDAEEEPENTCQLTIRNLWDD